MNEAILEVENLKKHFSSNTKYFNPFDWMGSSNIEKVRAVDGISFKLYQNETMGIVGESGCGKSTLGWTIALLHSPTSGKIYFKGTDATNLSSSETRQFRKDVQIIFQDADSSLNPRMKVRNLIAEPINNYFDLGKDELEKRIDDLLSKVDLPLEFKDRYPHELSGGQKQRVLISRALAPQPELIVADEPVSGLDVSIQSKIINLLKNIRDDFNLSILFISHDLTIIRRVSDRAMVLYSGQVAERGDADIVFSNPQHPYAKSLKKAIPASHPSGDKAEGLSGEPPSSMNPPSGCRFHPRCPAYIGDICEDEAPKEFELSDGRGVTCHHFNDNLDSDTESQDPDQSFNFIENKGK